MLTLVTSFKISKFQNLTFFDLTLNLISIFFDKIKSYGILTVIFEFHVEIGPSNMCHTT